MIKIIILFFLFNLLSFNKADPCPIYCSIHTVLGDSTYTCWVYVIGQCSYTLRNTGGTATWDKLNFTSQTYFASTSDSFFTMKTQDVQIESPQKFCEFDNFLGISNNRCIGKGNNSFTYFTTKVNSKYTWFDYLNNEYKYGSFEEYLNISVKQDIGDQMSVFGQNVANIASNKQPVDFLTQTTVYNINNDPLIGTLQWTTLYDADLNNALTLIYNFLDGEYEKCSQMWLDVKQYTSTFFIDCQSCNVKTTLFTLPQVGSFPIQTCRDLFNSGTSNLDDTKVFKLTFFVLSDTLLASDFNLLTTFPTLPVANSPTITPTLTASTKDSCLIRIATSDAPNDQFEWSFSSSLNPSFSLSSGTTYGATFDRDYQVYFPCSTLTITSTTSTVKTSILGTSQNTVSFEDPLLDRANEDSGNFWESLELAFHSGVLWIHSFLFFLMVIVPMWIIWRIMKCIYYDSKWEFVREMRVKKYERMEKNKEQVERDKKYLEKMKKNRKRYEEVGMSEEGEVEMKTPMEKSYI